MNSYSSYCPPLTNQLWINQFGLLWINVVMCLLLQDDHEITIEELEMRYTTNVTKVRHVFCNDFLSLILCSLHSSNRFMLFIYLLFNTPSFFHSVWVLQVPRQWCFFFFSFLFSLSHTHLFNLFFYSPSTGFDHHLCASGIGERRSQWTEAS